VGNYTIKAIKGMRQPTTIALVDAEPEEPPRVLETEAMAKSLWSTASVAEGRQDGPASQPNPYEVPSGQEAKKSVAGSCPLFHAGAAGLGDRARTSLPWAGAALTGRHHTRMEALSPW
jgi:hypothetical protein